MKKLMILLLAISLFSSAYREGASPEAENLEITVMRNGSVESRLTAHDDSPGPLRFEITTEPVKGTVRLAEDGSFVYTPEAGQRGRDYFGYKAYDEEGNASQEATVIIQICRE